MPQLPLDWFSDEELYYWKQDRETLLILELLRSFLLEKRPNPNITILDIRSAQGFVLSTHSFSMSLPFWQKLIFYWVGMLKSDGYVLQNREVNEAKGATVYFMYLKPSIRNSTGPLLSQKYGNVIIELEEKNEKASSLKFQINRYSDRRYAVPQSISDLYSKLTC